MNEDTTEFIFKLIMQRYNNSVSTIFTSNKSFEDWEVLFGQKQRAGAAIDRITERAEIMLIDGSSYRQKGKIVDEELKSEIPVVN